MTSLIGGSVTWHHRLDQSMQQNAAVVEEGLRPPKAASPAGRLNERGGRFRTR